MGEGRLAAQLRAFPTGVAPKGSDEVLIAGHEKPIVVRLQTPFYLPTTHLRSMDKAW